MRKSHSDGRSVVPPALSSATVRLPPVKTGGYRNVAATRLRNPYLLLLALYLTNVIIVVESNSFQRGIGLAVHHALPDNPVELIRRNAIRVGEVETGGGS